MLTFLMLGRVSKFTLLSLNRKVAAMVRHTEWHLLVSRYDQSFLSLDQGTVFDPLCDSHLRYHKTVPKSAFIIFLLNPCIYSIFGK